MNEFYTKEQFDGYMKQLNEDGYVVVPSIVSKDKAKEFQSGFFDYLAGLNKNIDKNDYSTWKGENFPYTIGGIFKNYKIGHIQPIWDARVEPGILEFYQRYWNEKDLLVSYDGACLLGPGGAGLEHVERGIHTDQGNYLQHDKSIAKELKRFGGDRDFMCLQGLLNLNDCGDEDGGFYCLPGSHKHHKDFFKKNKLETWDRNWYMYSHPSRHKNDDDDQFKKKLENGIKYIHKFKGIKVNCKSGDMIFFYSRLAHTAVPTTKNSVTHRLCFYISMLPKCLATKEDLDLKKSALEEMRTTSHWACMNIKLTSVDPKIGERKVSFVDNFDVSSVKPPKLTQQMLALCGITQ